MNSLLASARFSCEIFRLWAAHRELHKPGTRFQHLEHCRRWMWRGVIALAICAMLTSAMEADAQMLFDRIGDEAETRQLQWFTSISTLVRPTFMLLGTIEICWAAAIWAFERDNLSSFTIELIKKIMTIGFFLLLLENAPQWIPAIFNTFERAGMEATGITRLSTDTILTEGILLALRLWGAVTLAATAAMLVPLQIMGSTIPGAPFIHGAAQSAMMIGLVGAAIIVVSYVIVAAQFFCLKVESAILLAAGAIFLGLGSSSWTRDYVSKYFNYTINVGVRLLVLILILSLTMGQLNDIVVAFVIPDVRPILYLTGAAILQAILAIKAPELAGALLSGGSGLTAGSASGAAGGMVRSMASGAIAALNTARGVGNLVKATNAGRSAGAAQSNRISGGGMQSGPNAQPGAAPAIAGLGGNPGGAGGAANAPRGPANATPSGSAANTLNTGANSRGQSAMAPPGNPASNGSPSGSSRGSGGGAEQASQNSSSMATQESRSTLEDARTSSATASQTESWDNSDSDSFYTDRESLYPDSDSFDADWGWLHSESVDSPDSDRSSRRSTAALTLSGGERTSRAETDNSPPPAYRSSPRGNDPLRKGSVPHSNASPPRTPVTNR